LLWLRTFGVRWIPSGKGLPTRQRRLQQLLALFWRPSVGRRDDHADARHTREVTSLGQPPMGTGRSLDRDPPTLRHLVTRGYRLARLILAVPDLTFQHTRYL
jgi:hypothetical protein